MELLFWNSPWVFNVMFLGLMHLLWFFILYEEWGAIQILFPSLPPPPSFFVLRSILFDWILSQSLVFFIVHSSLFYSSIFG